MSKQTTTSKEEEEAEAKQIQASFNLQQQQEEETEEDLTFSSHALCMMPSSTQSPYGQESIGLALDVIIVAPDSYDLNNPASVPPVSTSAGPQDAKEKDTIPTDDTNCLLGCGQRKRPDQDDVLLPHDSADQEEEKVPSTKRSSKGIFASSDFALQFPDQYYHSSASASASKWNKKGHSSSSSSSSKQGGKEYIIRLKINGSLIDEAFLSMNLPSKDEKSNMMCTFTQGKSSKPPTAVLEQLVQRGIIIPGRNLVRYILVDKTTTTTGNDNDTDVITVPNDKEQQQTKKQPVSVYGGGVPIGTAEAHIYLWSVHDTIIISDIDGTITKSDVRGVIDSIMMESYAHVHAGVCSFFSELVLSLNNMNNTTKSPGGDDNPSKTTTGRVRLLYLSSRPISLINTTRKFLMLLSQSSAEDPDDEFQEHTTADGDDDKDKFQRDPYSLAEGSKLPPGPIFLHTGTIAKVLVAELVKKSTHEFKADVLARQVVLPFIAAGKHTMSTLFLAGFGNKETDAMAYEMVGIEKSDIYIINKKSLVVSTLAESDNKDDDGNIEDDDDDDDVLDPNNVIHGCCALLDPISGLEMEEEHGKNTLQPINISVSASPKKPRKLLRRRKQKHINYQGYTDPKLKKVLLHKIKEVSSI